MTTKIIPKKWHKSGGRQVVKWLEWDGHCMCTKVSKSGEVELPINPDIVLVSDAIKKQIYGHNS